MEVPIADACLVGGIFLKGVSLKRRKLSLFKSIKNVTKIVHTSEFSGQISGRFPHVWGLVVSNKWGRDHAVKSFFHEVGHAIDDEYEPKTGDSEKFAFAFSFLVVGKSNEELSKFWSEGSRDPLSRWRGSFGYPDRMTHNETWYTLSKMAEVKLNQHFEDIMKLLEWTEQDDMWKF